MEEQHRKLLQQACIGAALLALLPAPVSLHLHVSGLFRDWGRGVC